MPIRFFLDSHLQVVRTTYLGDITLVELASYARELVTGGLLDLGQLIDGRTARLLLSEKDTQELSELMGAFRRVYGRAPVAMVVGNAASYQVAQRYWEMGAGANPGYQVFEDVAAAEMWLVISRR